MCGPSGEAWPEVWVPGQHGRDASISHWQC